MNGTKKILIVDDDARFRDLIEETLIGEGFTVLSAENGTSGLKRALSEHPDLMLLDIDMPDMKGTDVLKKLREDAWGKDAKVVMLTAHDDLPLVADTVEAGVHEYLVKGEQNLKNVIEVVKKRTSETK